VNADRFGRTERFDIFRVRVERDPDKYQPRDVYMAWYHSEDFHRPACVVTLWDWTAHSDDKKPHVFVEWVEVDELERRKGIGTEVMSFLISRIEGITYTGATEEGEALCEKLDRLRGVEA
jgi:GNAT superfamily N-acetyltransferase